MILAINRWVWVFSALGIFARHVDAKASQAYTYAADRTVNHEIHAVPAPGPVTIDGVLDEWDTLGGILACKDVNRVLDRYATWFYMMYDRDALYVAARVTDHTPMVNDFDPRFEERICHRGDTVFFRFQSGEHYSNFFVYYWTQGQQPAVVLASGRAWHKDEQFRDGLAAGCEVAFDKFADGTGYFVEMRIPWAVITGDKNRTPPQAGDQFPGSVGTYWNGQLPRSIYEFNYFDLSDRDQSPPKTWWYPKVWGTVKLSRHGDLELPTPPWLTRVPVSESKPGPVAVRYDLPHDAHVTIVVEDEQGERIRNLIADTPRAAGANTDAWDGRDDEGNLVAPGSYRARGLWHPEFDALYQFAYGSPGAPAWETADGTGSWISDYSPCSVATDGQSVFVSGLYLDCGVGTVRLTEDGRREWGLRPPSMIKDPVAAVDEKYLYLACGREAHYQYDKRGDKSQPDDTILFSRIDKESGNPVAFEGETRPFVPLTTVEPMTGLPYESYGEIVERGAFRAEIMAGRVKGLAVGPARAFIASYFEDEVLVVDKSTGKLLNRFSVPRPAGLEWISPDELLVVSAEEKKVLRMDPDTGETSPVVNSGLEAPMDLAVDADGNIFVSDWGRAMCVKVFSREGTFLHAVGKEGGRAWIGSFDPSGMLNPFGIDIDSRGRLWVVEFDGLPRRISVWGADGEFEKEFIAAGSYAGSICWILPDQPERAIASGGVFELDWDRGQYRLLETLWRPVHRDAHFGPYQDAHTRHQVTINGRSLLVSQTGKSFVAISEQKGDRHQPLAAVGSVAGLFASTRGKYGQLHVTGLRYLTVPTWIRDHLYWSDEVNRYIAENHPEAFDGTFYPSRVIWWNKGDYFSRTGVKSEHGAPSPTTNFTWSDRNGDGLVQQEEVTYFEAPGMGPTGFEGGWTVGVTPDLTIYQKSIDGGFNVWKLPVVDWTESGAPVYDGPHAELIIQDPDHGFSNCLWADSRGNLLSNSTGGMMMYSPDGKRLWRYPNPYAGVHASHTAPMSDRGMLIGPLFVIGSLQVEGLGEVFAFNGNLGQAFLMTTDGLYVGSLFRDVRSTPDALSAKPVRGESHRDTTMGGEWFGGQLFRNPRDGKPYIVGEHHSAGGNCIYELTGLDEAKRLADIEILFSPEAYAEAQAMAGPGSATEEQEDPLVVQMGRPTSAVTIDGIGNEYDSGTEAVARFRKDDAHQATAMASYDDSNLYLFYSVQDASPLQNSGRLGINELFKSGDCVLFELGTIRDVEDTSSKLQRGDWRLLLAKKENEHIAVLYNYVRDSTNTWIEISSGLGTLRVDEFKVIAGARIATRLTKSGYTLEASIPLDELGFLPEPGKDFRGDFGVVYSDLKGTTNRLRMHWATRDTGLVSDAYNEAQVKPAQWGRIRIR